MIKHFNLLGILTLGCIYYSVSVDACTNFLIKGAPLSGVVASARTVDFSIPIIPKILAVPRGLPWVSRGEDASKPTGSSWTNRYGFVAVGASNEENLFLDGINEAGLSAAILWLDEAGYMKRQGTNDVSSFDLVSYIIGQYTSVAEAKAALKDLNVYGNFLPEYKMIIPLHLVVMDANGDSFVAEWIDGSLKIYDAENTKGYVDVLSNSPPYDKQLENLANYSQLSCYNNAEYSLTGLPGNSSSESRFVRSAKLKECSEHLGGDPTKAFLVETKEEAMQTAS
jgi:choloylglycine hydrolase